MNDALSRETGPYDYLSRGRLDGKRVLVIGAGDGIGRATCHALSQAGAIVIALDKDGERARSVAQEVSGVAISADVAVPGSLERAIFSIRDSGLHGVVDVVGMARSGPLVEIDHSTYDWQFNIVTRHVFELLRVAPEIMVADGTAAIAVVGSMAGLTGIAGQAAYGAAKAAMHHLVKVAAIEFGPLSIRVNAVAPFYVQTPRLKAALSEHEWAQIAALTPMGRPAMVEEIASCLLFLLSEQSSYVNGHVLRVDGGGSAGMALPTVRWNAAPST
ncbi:SDR family NAD(P)-dependent oxidoreductase [Microbacterium sp. A94]|uniref:SDR family NAD(P)-dependent oxidoreductase n=1 Tax=Microbacterium sp. A94 TaxID=3450717 RepID=UPI003F42711E